MWCASFTNLFRTLFNVGTIHVKTKQHSAFHTQHSAVNVQRSAFKIPYLRPHLSSRRLCLFANIGRSICTIFDFAATSTPHCCCFVWLRERGCADAGLCLDLRRKDAVELLRRSSDPADPLLLVLALFRALTHREFLSHIGYW